MPLFILMEARGGGRRRAGWSDDTHDCALEPQQSAERVQRAEVASLVNRWRGEAQLGRGRRGSLRGAVSGPAGGEGRGQRLVELVGRATEEEGVAREGKASTQLAISHA